MNADALTPNAELLAMMCVWSYPIVSKSGRRESSSHWKRRIETLLAEDGFESSEVIDYSDVQAIIAERGNHRVTCFRGTDSAKDMLTNFFSRKVMSTIVPKVCIHREFNNDVAVIRGRVRSIDYSDKKHDWFVGHSRGGAAASIMAAEIAHETKKCVHLVTFEMPRAGGKQFANFLREHVAEVRFQRAGDIVPLVPTWPFFWHSIPPAFFDSKGLFRPGAGWITRLVSNTLAIAKQIGSIGLGSVSNHSMSEMHKIITEEEGELGRNLLFELMDCKEGQFSQACRCSVGE